MLCQKRRDMRAGGGIIILVLHKSTVYLSMIDYSTHGVVGSHWGA